MREMPLTLWILVTVVVLYLYLRRAHLGIDLHPAEGGAQHPVPSAQHPTVRLPVKGNGR